MYYLSTQLAQATSLLHELYSILAGLEVHVVTLHCKMTERLEEDDLRKTVKE